MWRILTFLLVLVTMCLSNIVVDNTLPPIKILAYHPSGLQITMPDSNFKSVVLIGDVKRGPARPRQRFDLYQAKQGYWIFTDRKHIVWFGDVFSFHIYITLKDGVSYNKTFSWTVNALVTEVGIPNCEISETITLNGKTNCRNDLIFSEEFNDADKFEWKKENMFPQEPDYPFNSYTSRTVHVANGTLQILPEHVPSAYMFVGHEDYRTECTGEAGTRECNQTSSGAQILPPVVSGKVSTRKLFSFKYGRVEVRAKLPIGDWLIPEINLEPLSNEYGRQRYGSGLMRIAFVKGNREFSTELYSGPIISDIEPYRSMFLKTLDKSVHWNEDFHVYTLIWAPDGIKLEVDGIPYGDIKPIRNPDANNTLRALPQAKIWIQGTNMAPFDEMFYISLGVRVGGINDFPDSPEKPWKNSSNKAMYKFWQMRDVWKDTWTSPFLIVDYVRVHAL